jgi:hypothetical protein
LLFTAAALVPLSLRLPPCARAVVMVAPSLMPGLSRSFFTTARVCCVTAPTPKAPAARSARWCLLLRGTRPYLRAAQTASQRSLAMARPLRQSCLLSCAACCPPLFGGRQRPVHWSPRGGRSKSCALAAARAARRGQFPMQSALSASLSSQRAPRQPNETSPPLRLPSFFFAIKGSVDAASSYQAGCSAHEGRSGAKARHVHRGRAIGHRMRHAAVPPAAARTAEPAAEATAGAAGGGTVS